VSNAAVGDAVHHRATARHNGIAATPIVEITPANEWCRSWEPTGMAHVLVVDDERSTLGAKHDPST
jgi:hypothetical protein